MIRAASGLRDEGPRLLVVAQNGAHSGAGGERIAATSIDALADLLAPGDVVVVNDAATLPASLSGRVGSATIELRLAEAPIDGRALAVLFGEGDHRTRTEDRPPPPRVGRGDVLDLDGLRATIEAVDPRSPRLVTVRFESGSDALFAAIYARGRPIQYAHVPEPLPLWAVQTAFAERPWSVEMPSAGRPLRASTIAALRARGVEVVALTHGAGLSSTGDPAIDAALPFPERFEIPAKTAEAVRAARRVIAVGTTVTRALEGCVALHGEVRATSGVTDLRLGPTSRRRVVDAILTGLHEPGSSHFELLSSFASRAVLERALAHAEAEGLLGHELGDVALIFAEGRARTGTTAGPRRLDSRRGDPERRGPDRRGAVQAR